MRLNKKVLGKTVFNVVKNFGSSRALQIKSIVVLVAELPQGILLTKIRLIIVTYPVKITLCTAKGLKAKITLCTAKEKIKRQDGMAAEKSEKTVMFLLLPLMTTHIQHILKKAGLSIYLNIASLWKSTLGDTLNREK